MGRGVRPRFAGRGRERSWWLVVAAAAVTAFAGLAQVWHFPVHQRVGIAVLAPVLALVTSEFRARAAKTTRGIACSPVGWRYPVGADASLGCPRSM